MPATRNFFKTPYCLYRRCLRKYAFYFFKKIIIIYKHQLYLRIVQHTNAGEITVGLKEIDLIVGESVLIQIFERRGRFEEFGDQVTWVYNDIYNFIYQFEGGLKERELDSEEFLKILEQFKNDNTNFFHYVNNNNHHRRYCIFCLFSKNSHMTSISKYAITARAFRI